MPIGSRNGVIPGAGMHHIALQTRDWENSIRLYRDVLGMDVVAEFGAPDRKILLVDMGDGSHFELFQPTASTPKAEAAQSDDPLMHVAIATTDTRAAIERVREAGFQITMEPKDLSLGELSVTIAFFKGPSGEVLEFFQVH